MSGSTIGGVVGAVVGFYFGGPQGAQWGWMIGSAIGGAVDPDVIKAPSIGDAQRQTSQAGIPIPVIYGKPQRFKCNIIDGELKARKIIVEQQQGKGGPIVQSEKFLLTSAFGVCEGPIAGIQKILRNGEVVYDRTIESEFPAYAGATAGERSAYILAVRAKTASWSGTLRVYLGNETQNPDPALEAIHGVGNTPYFRGLAYFVVEDDDVTQTRGAASVWEVEPVAVGIEGAIVGGTTLAAGLYSRFSNSHWPLASGELDYTFTGYWVTGSGAGVTSPAYDSIQAVQDWAANIKASGLGESGPNVLGRPSNYIGYVASSGVSVGAYTSSTVTFDFVAEQPDATNLESVMLLYQWLEPELGWVNAAPNATCPLTSTNGLWLGVCNGMVVRQDTTPHSELLQIVYCSGPTAQGIYPLCITVTRKRFPPVPIGEPIPEAPGYYVMPDGSISNQLIYTPLSGTFKILAVATLTGSDPTRTYLHYELGPVLALGDPNYSSSAYWTAAYNQAVTDGKIEAGLTYGINYPVTVSSVYQLTAPPFSTLQATDVTLQSVIEAQAARARLPASRLDATALSTDIIPGYLVATGGTVADSIRPTQQPFFYDTPEADGKIKCVKRGGAIAVTITDDDLLEQSDDDAATTPQPIEFPKKVHFVVPDPDANYTPTPQTAERYTPDVRAVGEVSVALPIPFKKDHTKRKAEIMLNVAWNRAEGVIEIPLPEKFSQYIPSDCFTYKSKRWLIEEATYADGEVRWKAVYDRVSGYSSVAVGVAATPPTIPNSGLKGPTLLEVMNLPPLRDQDDKFGLYVACCGLLDNWPGAVIQASLDGLTWLTGPTVTRASVIGSLTSSLSTAVAYYFDPGATVSVHVRGQLSSVTFEEILAESNAAMIGDELIQFQTATDLGDGDYTLTGLARGRLHTKPTTHGDAERFVLLNAPVFFELPPEWADRVIRLRAITLGTAPGTGYDIVSWTPPRCQHEWTPEAFTGTRDTSNNITIDCVTRARLGTTAVPYQSAYFNGFRITITKASVSKVYATNEVPFAYSAAQQTADFGSATGTLTITIQAVNRITGPGFALVGTIA
ncbi:phage tail protein [Lysobacter fragariae]